MHARYNAMKAVTLFEGRGMAANNKVSLSDCKKIRGVRGVEEGPRGTYRAPPRATTQPRAGAMADGCRKSGSGGDVSPELWLRSAVTFALAARAR